MTTTAAGEIPALPETRRALKLSQFEGPLDLLLHLIEKGNLDITAVSLVDVTDQYLALLHADAEIDAGALADFVAIGSKLLYLKSRALLPRQETAEPEEQDDIAVDLTQQLEEYRRYKEAARLFREREDAGLRAYPRQAPPPPMPLGPGLDGVTADALLRIFQEALNRKPKDQPIPIRALERDTVTVAQKIETLRRALRRSGRVSFRGLIAACRTRVEVVVQFLAVLELLKLGELVARQDGLFTDIDLVAAEAAAAAARRNEDEGEAIA